MAKKRPSTKEPESDIKQASMKSRFIWAGLCFLIAVLLALALGDYTPYQVSIGRSVGSTNPNENNMVGILGAEASELLIAAFGRMSWFVPLFVGWLGGAFLARDRRNKLILSGVMLVAMITGSGLFTATGTTFANPEVYVTGAGGAVGNLLYNNLLHVYLGTVGSAVILGAIYLACLTMIVFPSLPESGEFFRHSFAEWRERRAAAAEERREAKRLAKLAAQEEKQRLKEEKAEAKRLAQEEKEATKALIREAKGKRAAEPEIDPEPKIKVNIPSRKKAAPAPEPEEEEPKKKTLGEVLKIVAPEKTKKARTATLPVASGNYTFPKLDLLAELEAPDGANSEEEHTENAERLKQTLKEFGVDVTMGEIHIGPVITRYEVYPAPGVRVEKISNLDKNIALGMRAVSVRILAPVPGKGCVGIEVPNQVPMPVGIREILESEDWVKSKAEIPIALGRDVSGKPIISDLTKMPHLLIAGATGAGKTVCINAIITSLLFHSSPENLRFIMVDPKIVEMKVFNSLPHMLIPVVTDPKKVPGALKWLLNEMESRYEMFAKVGVRNIAGFNGRKKPEKEKTEDEKFEEQIQEELEIRVPRDEGVLDEIPEKLPYIVCIVDELADLMMVAPADIETGIARLAQLARAAGIHLVLATQRPSVNVITGVIKANLPCRISFQVSSKIDSRTILDGGGAEQLIGRGDMLFSPPGSSRLVRSQGAFVSDEEIADIVEFLKANGPPKFAEEVQKQIEAGDEMDLGGGGEGGEDGDELFNKAIDVLRSTKRASTSMLQRRLRIGYNRAANLMDQLEDRGIVGPENGSSPREILVDLDSM
ncbi:DNA translocase FtsK 4TM domain-containing protein [Pelagicoccus sp. SDUM812005]|uniref:DNA translocase FtsK 4TM domain-containing protein n=1 Tax=Pelagicoccus sp. SDUM812005 TaxID=3041257 RepID=UPI00280E5F03|nr:DNA translocase FtsK 4TM domain-containing protein [Pelagicoccus sp. SDUM812005]MDQ8180670.1 DNA translocase FtsK 4TM domain-containing protein [Pelagicoccus sp. SDUM812005]